MEIETFIKNFKLLIQTDTFQEFEFYLFGSSLLNKKYIDIDILIIYNDFDNLKKVKEKIIEEFNHNLVHITSLTVSEEIELAFIKKLMRRKLNKKKLLTTATTDLGN